MFLPTHTPYHRQHLLHIWRHYIVCTFLHTPLKGFLWIILMMHAFSTVLLIWNLVPIVKKTINLNINTKVDQSMKDNIPWKFFFLFLVDVLVAVLPHSCQIAELHSWGHWIKDTYSTRWRNIFVQRGYVGCCANPRRHLLFVPIFRVIELITRSVKTMPLYLNNNK